MYLIVGLGNPGKQYENTRHNVGWRVLDRLAAKHGITIGKTEHKAQTGAGTILGKKVILAKPLTYMNLSGDAVQPLAHFYKITSDQILVIADDLDLPLGTLRIRKMGSSGGQNGLKHILQRMGNQVINRVRFGIGRPPGRMSAADYVLAPFKGDDDILATEVADRAVLAVETWLTDGVEVAMNRYNGTGEPKPKAEPKPKPESSPQSEPTAEPQSDS
ncbi:MAG: aminoacyl-tRNA hydrolase [Anaerolinea sp.]|nr:aminoacyl-tRNA hydrolase [Anaerolinea sp.]